MGRKEERAVTRELDRLLLREPRFVHLSKKVRVAQRKLKEAISPDAWQLFLRVSDLSNEMTLKTLDAAILVALRRGRRKGCPLARILAGNGCHGVGGGKVDFNR